MSLKKLLSLFFNKKVMEIDQSRSKNLANHYLLRQINLRLDSTVYHFLYHLNYFQSFFHLRQFILYNSYDPFFCRLWGHLYHKYLLSY